MVTSPLFEARIKWSRMPNKAFIVEWPLRHPDMVEDKSLFIDVIDELT